MILSQIYSILSHVAFIIKTKNKMLSKFIIRAPLTTTKYPSLATKESHYKLRKRSKAIRYIIKPFTLSIKLVIIAAAIYYTSFLFILYGEPDKKNQEFLVKLHQYRTAVAVRDEDGNLLGIMRNTKPAPNKFIDANEKGEYKQAYNRESSLYVDNVPDFFWNVLLEREHGNLTFDDSPGVYGYIKGVLRGSYKGVDVSAPLKKIFKKITTGKGGGGSTLMNAMIKNLYGGDSYFMIKRNRSHECPPIIDLHHKVCRKWVEYRSAKDLFPLLSQNNGEEFKRWVAMHVPFVGSIGGNQGSLYGLQAASAVMFGEKPESLNIAQQSFIATSYLMDFRFSILDKKPSNSIKREEEWKAICEKHFRKWNRVERWECRKRVSKKFAEIVVDKQNSLDLKNKKPKINLEFANLERPIEPKIPLILAPFFHEEKASKKEKIKKYANLHTRLSKFMPGFKIPLKKELNDFTESYKNGHVVEVTTTLPLYYDFLFRKSIDVKLSEIEKNHSFNKSLLGATDKSDAADIRISVSRINGQLIRYYLREGEYAVEEKVGMPLPLRPIASISKIPLATLLISKGANESDSFCNAFYKNLGNAGGDKGNENCSTTYTLEESIAQSKNLPLRYALSEKKNIETSEIKKLFENFGIQDDLKPNSTNEREHLIENLSFGRAQGTAAQTHRIMHKLSQIMIYNNTYRTPKVSTIKNFVLIDYQDGKPTKIPLSGERLSEETTKIDTYLNDKNSISILRKILNAPISHDKGTLNFLNEIKNGKILYGKTGTFENNNKKTKDKYVIGTLIVNKKYYTFSVLIGASDFNKEGLIDDISTKGIMKPIVQTIINSIYHESINKNLLQ